MNLLLNNYFRIALGAIIFLLIPIYFNYTGSGVDGDGFHWSVSDFVLAFSLIFVIGSLFEFVRKKASNNKTYKFASALALAGLFSLVWVNAAVGIIGDDDINMLYAVVVFTLFIGTIISRLKPIGLSKTLYAAAIVQFLIPVVALMVGVQDFRPGVIQVFLLNSFWVMIFIGSGVLFKQASLENN